MKRLALLGVLLAAVLLTGCLAPKVNFKIEPNPIEVTFEKFELAGVKLHVTLSGFSFGYTVEAAVIEVRDNEGEVVFEDTVKLNKEIPVIPGWTETVDLPTVNLASLLSEIASEYRKAAYDQKFKDETFELEITLTGKNPTSGKVDLVFK